MSFMQKLTQPFKRKKITLRVSILSLFLTLYLSFGAILITVTYVNLNKALFHASGLMIQNSILSVEEEIIDYFKPMAIGTQLAKDFITFGDIQTSDPNKILGFLTRLVDIDHEVFAVFWATEKGNLYVVKNFGKTQYFQQITQNTNGKFTKTLTVTEGDKVLKRDVIKTTAKDDPRTYNAYKLAIKKGKTIWTDVHWLKHSPKLGISILSPIYNASKALKGVFAMDIELDGFSAFLNHIRISENSKTFVLDKEGNIIAGLRYDSKAAPKKLSDETKFNIPNIHDSPAAISQAFKFYNQEKIDDVFEFEYKGESYLADFHPLTGVFAQDWLVGTVVPVNDILTPLKNANYIIFFYYLLVLALGALLIRIFAKRVSRPIKLLTIETNKIKKLKLTDYKRTNSIIKEVSELEGAINSMKNSLRSFKRYMPAKLVSQLINTGKVAEIGGDKRMLTILFMDIRNFTTVSEAMAPEKLAKHLTAYFQVVSDIIDTYQGTVDKYIGDAVMAFWGAPTEDDKQVIHACHAALEIEKKLYDLNLAWQSEGEPIFFTRIGIHHGESLVGNFGSKERLNYTAMGDTVNIASRLEALNKNYGTSIIISEAAHQKAKHKFNCVELGEATLKGRYKPVRIYSLLSEIEDNSLMDQPLNILQLTDFHLFSDKKGELLGVNTFNSLKAVLDTVKENNHEKPDAIVLSGDLSQDETKTAYETLVSLLNSVGLNSPTYYIPGNHDNHELMQTVFNQHTSFEHKKQFVANNWRVVLLNSQKPGHVEGLLSKEELRYLEHNIEITNATNVLIFVHHHLASSKCKWLDKINLHNTEAVQALIRKYPHKVKAIVSGHIHQETEHIEDNVLYLTTPSTCIQFKTQNDEFAVEPLAPGYRWISLYMDGRIETKVHRVKGYKSTVDLDSEGYK